MYDESRDFYAQMVHIPRRRFARCFGRDYGNIAMRYFPHNNKEKETLKFRRFFFDFPFLPARFPSPRMLFGLGASHLSCALVSELGTHANELSQQTIQIIDTPAYDIGVFLMMHKNGVQCLI